MIADTLYTVGIAIGLIAVVGLNAGLAVTFWLERRGRR